MTKNADPDIYLQDKPYRMGCFSLQHGPVWFRLWEETPPVCPCESLAPPGSASLGPARTLSPMGPHLDFPCPSVPRVLLL